MDVVEKLGPRYGERCIGAMRAGHQAKLLEEGAACLDREFPMLDRLVRSRIVR